jgi:rod shape-determining protein MreC
VPKPRRSRRTLTLVVLVVVSLSVISLDLNGRTHSLTSGVKSVANSIFSPLRSGVIDILSPVGNFLAGAVHYGSLQAENEKLRATVGQLQTQQAEKGFQNTQLRALTALENLPFLGSLPTVTAPTQEVSTSNFAMTITIGKGRSDGVDVGMPVVGSGGLVGQVIQSFHHTAVVQLITDGQSKVAVVFGSNITGTVDGQGPDHAMSADLVPPGTALRQGEIMFTSSLNAASLPAGIPVARVASFHTSAGASQETIAVTPEADMSHLEYVSVVLWEPPA